jgi:membrane fusion protein, multidrug efflux system
VALQRRGQNKEKMDSQPPMQPDPNDPEQQPGEPPRRRLSRRGMLLGGAIAILVVAGVGWLAWDLTHQVPAAGSTAGGPNRGGGGGPGGGGGGGGGPGGRAPATTVGVAAAEQTDIPITIDALGTVVPQATVHVRPQVNGVLNRLLYKEGQMVRKGDLLAEIDPRQFEMTLQQALGARMKDEAQLEAARVTLQRYRTLLAQDSIARQDVDTQAALVKQLEAAVVSDKANEGNARLNLSYTRITAPLSGRVGLRPVDVGNVVSTGDANGVALITQLSPIDVEFSIPQDAAPSLQQNLGAFMEAKALDRTRTQMLDTGVFASLDNQVDTQTGTVRAKARFNNAKQALFPSQFVNVQINVRTIHDAVVVPVSALRQSGNGQFVFVLNDDRTVSQRPVKAGVATVDKVQIITGLKVGERVITEGADRLRDGSRVVLPGDTPGAGGQRGFSGGRRRGAEGGASAPAQPMTPGSGLPPEASASSPRRMGAHGGASAVAPAPNAAAPAPTEARSALPSAEQRQRLLDGANGDPEQLARRKAFLDKLDKGDPDALARWQQMQQRRAQGGGAAGATQ